MKNVADSKPRISISTLANLLPMYVDQKMPVMIWGPPGIGKSECIYQLALTGLGEGCAPGSNVFDIRLSNTPLEYLRGVPYVDSTGNQRWGHPSVLPTAEEAAKHKFVIIFFDEMNSAHEVLQAAAYEGIQDRRIGSYKFPDNAFVVAAGNGREDGGVTFTMPKPLRNRFAAHFYMRVDFDDWKVWAINNMVCSDIVAYLDQNQSDLFKFDPTSAEDSFATPRSWIKLGRMIDHLKTIPNMVTSDFVNVISAAIGQGIGAKFNLFRMNNINLPTVTDIGNGVAKNIDDDAGIGQRFTVMLEMSYAIKRYIDEHNDRYMKREFTNQDVAYFENMLSYLRNNFTEELQVVFLTTIRSNLKVRLAMMAGKIKSYDALSERFTSEIMGFIAPRV